MSTGETMDNDEMIRTCVSPKLCLTQVSTTAAPRDSPIRSDPKDKGKGIVHELVYSATIEKDIPEDDESIHSVSCSPSDNLGIGECEEHWSEGYCKLDCYLGFVQRIEEELATIPSFDQRRDYLWHFRHNVNDWPFGEEEWESVYAMLLSRNPSEIPHRKRYEENRRRIERSIHYSGTDRKEGRNFRYPGDLSFSVLARQKQLFGNWSWSMEITTTNDWPVDTGPSDEQVEVTVTPPRNYTWAGITEAQRAAVQSQWTEKHASATPNFQNPMPTIRRGIGTVRRRLRPATVKAKMSDVRDSVQWEWNPVEIVRCNWPGAFGFGKRTLRKLRPATAMVPNESIELTENLAQKTETPSESERHEMDESAK